MGCWRRVTRASASCSAVEYADRRICRSLLDPRTSLPGYGGLPSTSPPIHLHPPSIPLLSHDGPLHSYPHPSRGVHQSAFWPAAVAVAAVARRVARGPVARRSGSDGFAPGISRAAAAAAATAMATSTPAASTPAVIYFPSPPPGVPRVGRFHALPSLQCRLHPGAAGGASPDHDVVAAPAAASPGSSWMLHANDTTAPVFIP